MDCQHFYFLKTRRRSSKKGIEDDENSTNLQRDPGREQLEQNLQASWTNRPMRPVQYGSYPRPLLPTCGCIESTVTRAPIRSEYHRIGSDHPLNLGPGSCTPQQKIVWHFVQGQSLTRQPSLEASRSLQCPPIGRAQVEQPPTIPRCTIPIPQVASERHLLPQTA